MAANKPPAVKIAGIRGSIPSGYLLGRISGGNGDVELITQAKAKSAGLIPSSLPPSGTAGGDLSGTFPNPTVTGLQGRPVAATAPDSFSVLHWSGTAWAPYDLATVAYTGLYSDLIGPPAIHNVPAGGTAGQVLTKVDATDYNTSWTTPGGSGGSSGASSVYDDGTNLYLAITDTDGQLVLDGDGDPVFVKEVLPPAAMPIATSSAFGAVKPDGITLQVLAGILGSKAAAFLVNLSVAQSVADATLTTILFDNVVLDTLGGYSAVTGRFTPTLAGKWMVFSSCQGGVATSISLVQCFIRKIGVTIVATAVGGLSAAPSVSASPFSVSIASMNGTTDYLDAQGYVSGTGGSNVIRSGTQTFFGAIYLGA